MIWFTPPFNKACATNIGRQFLCIVDKHFGEKTNKFHKIFNRNLLKVSYSCLPNMRRIVTSHNKKITSPKDKVLDPCNCRNKNNCPFSGSCQSSEIVYKAKVIPDNGDTKHYIGLTENKFKQRYANHTSSLVHEEKSSATELSKYVWNLRARNQPFSIRWSILCHASAYSNTVKKCNLCLAEKLQILKSNKQELLNKRSELISKCRHQNKYCLSNYYTPRQKCHDPTGSRKIGAKFKKNSCVSSTDDRG